MPQQILARQRDLDDSCLDSVHDKLHHYTLFWVFLAYQKTIAWKRRCQYLNQKPDPFSLFDVAVSQNDVESVLNFATDNVRKKRFWTTVRLMDKVLKMPRLSPSQRFVAQTIRCIGLARLREMIDNPDRIKTELDIAQAGWVSYQTSAESLRTSAGQGIVAAKQLFDSLDQPTRQHKVLRAQLEKVNPGMQND